MRAISRIVTIGVFVCMAWGEAAWAQVVALGASNTAGQGVSSSEAYPAQLEAMLAARGKNVRVANAGVSGDTTGGMLGRLDGDVPQGTRIVILQAGFNDMRRGGGGAERQANIAKIQARLRARGIKVIPADNLVMSALRAGFRQPDGIHLTAQGHQRVAAGLAASVR